MNKESHIKAIDSVIHHLKRHDGGLFVSSFQMYLRIGYNCAMDILEDAESRGVIQRVDNTSQFKVVANE